VNLLLKKLEGGTLISDGCANAVSDAILANPQLLENLLEGLIEKNGVVRARTAHALERISRTRPDLLQKSIPVLVDSALIDPVPMVRWHMTVILANIDCEQLDLTIIFSALFQMLADKSSFVKCWTISSLVVLALKNKNRQADSLRMIRMLSHDDAKAVRARTIKAIDILENGRPVPQNWIKRRV
jgi:HEAT repeat protein